jgi:hypothetical protein
MGTSIGYNFTAKLEVSPAIDLAMRYISYQELSDDAKKCTKSPELDLAILGQTLLDALSEYEPLDNLEVVIAPVTDEVTPDGRALSYLSMRDSGDCGFDYPNIIDTLIETLAEHAVEAFEVDYTDYDQSESTTSYVGPNADNLQARRLMDKAIPYAKHLTTSQLQDLIAELTLLTI